MVDISLLDPEIMTNILLIAISGTLICIGVHFVHLLNLNTYQKIIKSL